MLTTAACDRVHYGLSKTRGAAKTLLLFGEHALHFIFDKKQNLIMVSKFILAFH